MPVIDLCVLIREHRTAKAAKAEKAHTSKMEGLLKATRAATASLRQKDPLAHRRKRRQRPNNPMAGMGGLDIHAEMKNMLGKLDKEDMKKADQLWKMLDNMYESDPAEYQKFIEKQMKIGAEQKQKEEEENNGDGKSSGSGLEVGAGGGSLRGLAKHFSESGVKSSAPKSDVKRGTFTPRANFVVKAIGRYLKDKYFLNICDHKGVQRPMGASGKAVMDDTQPHLARQIPLLVGIPRASKDVAGNPCTVVDVVFHPWVTSNVAHNNMFKAQVVELAMQWVANDHNIKFDTRWKCPKSKYKGGIGPRGYTPVPFPLEVAMDQGSEGSKGKAAVASGAASAVTRASKTTAAAAESKKAGSEIDLDGIPEELKKYKQEDTPDPLSNPESLLSAVRQADDRQKKRDSASTMDAVPPSELLNQKQVSPEKRGGLIQECNADGEVEKDDLDLTGSASNSKTKKKSKKKKKSTGKAVKKGFLNSVSGDKGLGLYPEGGSQEDGFTTGRPKKGSFLDKCKVVDTRSMDEASMQQTMAEYAATGSTSAPASIATSGGRADAARRSGKKTPTEVPRTKKPNPVEDADFDRLMELVDPDSSKTNVSSQDGLDNALGLGKGDMDMLQKMLFDGGLPGSKSSTSKNQPPPAPVAKTMPGLKGKLNLPALKYTIESDNVTDKQGNSAIRCTIMCPGCKNFAELELEMSDHSVKLRAPAAKPLVVRLPCKVDASKVSAKFKKKVQKLILTMPRA